MNHALLRSLLLLALGGLTGCATIASGPGKTEDPHEATRAALAGRAEVPDARQMLHDVEVVTFAYRRAGEERRDTIRGSTEASIWLESLRFRSGDGNAAFGLRSTEILVCDGAALERGKFPVPDIVNRYGSNHAGAEAGYLALWRPVEGAWRLERLWLSPPVSLRVGDIASGCHGKPRPLRLGMGGRMGGSPVLDGVVTFVDEAAWPTPEVEPTSAVGPLLWVGYRPAPDYGIRALYSRVGGASVSAGEFWGSGSSRQITVEVSGHVLAATGEARVGPFWIAAGPALALMTVDRRTKSCAKSLCSAEEVLEPSRLLGANAEAAYRYAVFSPLVPILSLSYLHFPDLEPEVVDRAAIPLGGLTLTMGMEWSP